MAGVSVSISLIGQHIKFCLLTEIRNLVPEFHMSRPNFCSHILNMDTVPSVSANIDSSHTYTLIIFFLLLKFLQLHHEKSKCLRIYLAKNTVVEKVRPSPVERGQQLGGQCFLSRCSVSRRYWVFGILYRHRQR